ncbi:MAG: hypothetical protein ACI4EI_05945, partial [Muricoprocola sp.]
ETETETESETESESETETETEKQTEKERQKQTEKKTTTQSSTETKTSVKPSTVSPSTTQSSGNTATQNQTQNYGTQQCPYCYNQISLAPNGDGTTVYSVHVAQEKAWADTYGYGDQSPASQDASSGTDQNTSQDSTNTDDVAQCPYCYQWFSVSDGSYDNHVANENTNLGLPEGSDYITCPNCGNTYARGIEFDTHYCSTQ